MLHSAFELQQFREDCEIQISNATTFQVLSVLIPSNSPAWHERTDYWFAFFYVMLCIYCVVFLGIALACVFLLIKRHLVQRFRVRTFIVIDLALITLGVSRVLFLLLDPWGQLGFCKHLACVVISRLLGSLAFPSLTASYTLVFITLWLSARIHLGTSWIQRLKVLIPLCFLHYGVAIIFEIVASLPFKQPLAIVLILIACEAFFSIWGFLVCFSFMIAGFRLLRTMKKSATSSSMICRDTPSISRHDLINKSKSIVKGKAASSKSIAKRRKIFRGQQKKSVRKVTLITYITVFLGMIYSILGLLNLVMVILVIFNGCFGMIKNTRQHPELWLALRYVMFTLESCMAVLLTYAVSDYTPLINVLKKCFQCNKEDLPAVENTTCSLSTESNSTTLVNSLSRTLTYSSTQECCNPKVSKSPSPLSAQK